MTLRFSQPVPSHEVGTTPIDKVGRQYKQILMLIDHNLTPGPKVGLSGLGQKGTQTAAGSEEVGHALKMCENCAQTNSGMLIIPILLNLNLPFQEFGSAALYRRSLERSSKSLQEFGLGLAES